MNRKRRYTLKRRADSQADTRRRIVEATVALHTEIGPARTSISAVAERAGVQRHTVYAHFPTEKDLYLACSGLAMERDPMPDQVVWQDIADPELRLRRALKDLYAWYGRNTELFSNVFRDVDVHPPTREIVDLRMGPRMKQMHEAIGRGFRPTVKLSAALDLALSFHTWRLLTVQGKLSPDAAVDFMVCAIRCAADKH
jgi:AcrR family transcriptional regulator